jgi:hypothetical protein
MLGGRYIILLLKYAKDERSSARVDLDNIDSFNYTSYGSIPSDINICVCTIIYLSSSLLYSSK